MKVYTVHVPQALEDTVFVKEGMAWPCLVIPVLWMLWHRMWVPAAIVFACSLAIAAIGKVGGDSLTANLIAIGFQTAIALEANNLRRWSLSKAGYLETGVVAAANMGEAELRYFTAVDPDLLTEQETCEPPAKAFRTSSPGRPRSPSRSGGGQEPLGVFPEGSANQ